MKILHVCLANFYVDDSSYQENILTKMHLHQGHEVEILASTETFLDRTELGYVKPGRYCTKDGIPVTRLSYTGWIPKPIAVKVRSYEGVSACLVKFAPDIIFIHGPQFYNVSDIVAYSKEYKTVKIIVDSHTDFINSGRNFVSKYIQHKILYRWYVKQLIPICEVFYGVLPLRVQFLIDVYGVPAEKTALLEMGADDLVLNKKDSIEVRAAVRKHFGVNEGDILLFSGGKIRPSKKIVELIKAVNVLGFSNVKLAIVGTPIKSFADEYEKGTQGLRFIDLGWQSNESMYDYLLAADLAIFPGTHSVLWEQAVGVGLPCVFREIKGIKHLDIGGNCEFIEDVSVPSLVSFLNDLLANTDQINKMKEVAKGKGKIRFLYSEIARKAINI